MSETPKCPYCGAEMKVDTVRLTQHNWVGWYHCENCRSVGPSKSNCYTEKDAEESALSAALHRAEPETRPLTLDEIYAKLYDEDWNVAWIEVPDSQKAEPMCPYYKEENKIVFCAPPFVRVWKETISRYGKSWRCWPRKPTTEQMAAEKWEDEP